MHFAMKSPFQPGIERIGGRMWDCWRNSNAQESQPMGFFPNS
jgi:hypothetical protein